MAGLPGAWRSVSLLSFVFLRLSHFRWKFRRVLKAERTQDRIGSSEFANLEFERVKCVFRRIRRDILLRLSDISLSTIYLEEMLPANVDFRSAKSLSRHSYVKNERSSVVSSMRDTLNTHVSDIYPSSVYDFANRIFKFVNNIIIFSFKRIIRTN